MKPKWKHDCDKCRFLGGVFLPYGQLDWYVCGTTDRTVVARFSDEQSDNWASSTRFMGENHRIATEWGTDNKGFIGMHLLAEFMLKQEGESK